MNFYHITIATKPHPILDNIINKINENKEYIYVLGANENRNIGWNDKANFGVKLREVHDFIFKSSIQNEDIVLFTDAYDVIYAGNHVEIVKRFINMNTPIVFGSETTCNPDPDKANMYTNKNVKFPYLNSGMFIGIVGALRECMKNYVYEDKHDDQRFWTQKFFEYPKLFTLDYENQLFLNTYGIDIENINLNKHQIEYENKNPMIVHVNGPDKNDLNRFL